MSRFRDRQRNRGSGAGGAAAFSPKNLPGLTVWLRADLGSPSASSWPDQSGNANNATQATGANQPVYSASGWPNGKPCFTWATSKMMATPSLSLGTWTINVVYKLSGTAGYLAVFKSDAVNPGAYLYGTTTDTVSVQNSGGASQKELTSNWAVTNVAHTATWTFDGTHAGNLLYIDGVLQTLTNGGSTANPGSSAFAGPLYLGANATAAFASTGLLAEYVVCSGAMSAANITALHTYQSAFWGTP